MHGKTYTIPIQHEDLRRRHLKSCFHIVTGHYPGSGKAYGWAVPRCRRAPAPMSSSLDAASIVFKSAPGTPQGHTTEPAGKDSVWNSRRSSSAERSTLEREFVFSLYFSRPCAQLWPNPVACLKFSLRKALDQGIKRIQDQIPQRAKYRNGACVLLTAPCVWRDPGGSQAHPHCDPPKRFATQSRPVGPSSKQGKSSSLDYSDSSCSFKLKNEMLKFQLLRNAGNAGRENNKTGEKGEECRDLLPQPHPCKLTQSCFSMSFIQSERGTGVCLTSSPCSGKCIYSAQDAYKITTK